MIKKINCLKSKEEFYVNHLGEIFNQEGTKQNLTVQKNGYVYFKGIGVHRIVAITFLGEEKGYIVNHINHNRSDNRLENLEWITKKQNSNRTVLQTSSYTLFKECYQIYGNKHMTEFLQNLLKDGVGFNE